MVTRLPGTRLCASAASCSAPAAISSSEKDYHQLLNSLMLSSPEYFAVKIFSLP